MQSAVSKSTIYIENLSWADLRFCRNWLKEFDCQEASSLMNTIDELWDGVQKLDWQNIQQQQTWLNTVDKPAAKFLVKFLEDVKDLILDTDEMIMFTEQVDRPKHLKLVVSNYFTPRERIDQPAKPDPVLTLLP